MLQILCRGKQAGQTQLHFCGCVYSPACPCAYSLYILILVAHRMQYVLLVVFLLVRKGKNNTVMPAPSHHPDKLQTLVTWCPCTARGDRCREAGQSAAWLHTHDGFFSERDYEMLKENLEGFTEPYGNRRNE